MLSETASGLPSRPPPHAQLLVDIGEHGRFGSIAPIWHSHGNSVNGIISEITVAILVADATIYGASRRVQINGPDFEKHGWRSGVAPQPRSYRDTRWRCLLK